MQSVVVLNADYNYWTEVDLHRVLKWIVKDKIEIVVYDETKEIRSIEFRIKLPLVVRLLKRVGYKPKTEIVAYSQEAVFYRDDNLCQYWHKDQFGKKFMFKCNYVDRTLDHVLPVSRGGKSEFTNVVCACRDCNENIKRNRTPGEAGLELIRKPFTPTRDVHSYVSMKFTYHPGKLSHKIYMDWMKKFTN
jgi:5-methylcytosine-specific restriction endonuclease McrA